MSSEDKSNAKELQKISLEARRSIQFSVLKNWDKCKITGRQAIESIIELEKIIFMKKEDIQRIKDGKIYKPEDQKEGV